MAEEKTTTDASKASGNGEKKSRNGRKKAVGLMSEYGGHPEGCMCMGCRTTRMGCVCGCGKHSLYYSILRCLLLLVLLGGVFCIGIKVGEFHGMYESRYGKHYILMNGSDNYRNMMYFNENGTSQNIRMHLPATTSTSSKATSAPKDDL